MKPDPSEEDNSSNPQEPAITSEAQWDIHTDVIDRIQRHIITKGFQRTFSVGTDDTAELQHKMAMDRIAVMLTELTSNTSAVIDQFNRNPGTFDMDAFIKYLDASTDNATRLADEISSFADFRRSSDCIDDQAEMSVDVLERSTDEES